MRVCGDVTWKMRKTIDRVIECIAACEALQWPDCGRPSSRFTHPTPSGQATQTYMAECSLGWESP